MLVTSLLAVVLAGSEAPPPPSWIVARQHDMLADLPQPPMQRRGARRMSQAPARQNLVTSLVGQAPQDTRDRGGKNRLTAPDPQEAQDDESGGGEGVQEETFEDPVDDPPEPETTAPVPATPQPEPAPADNAAGVDGPTEAPEPPEPPEPMPNSAPNATRAGDGPVHTKGGCQCRQLWSFLSRNYSGCVDSPAGPWCAVKGGDCTPEGNYSTTKGDLVPWDYCSTSDSLSPLMTSNGCHCLNNWSRKGRTFSGCAIVDVKEPAICQVFETTKDCPKAFRGDDGALYDRCFFPTTAPEVQLDRTDARCHCMPIWTLRNRTYQHCAVAIGERDSSCPVLEDARLCPDASVRYGRRWDTCGGAGRQDNLRDLGRLAEAWVRGQEFPVGGIIDPYVGTQSTKVLRISGGGFEHTLEILWSEQGEARTNFYNTIFRPTCALLLPLLALLLSLYVCCLATVAEPKVNIANKQDPEELLVGLLPLDE
mmetsp:Transcript_43574/g.94964  ORF Transcript_43574/g.94964 Transcript_43574/m.94964 type:complete len:480 (+) Transcript_43574:122-1561(+)|eukprot:CAMPEP_0204272034 /NCGR_PEP_ID=MMETSP0468-20130131/21849_1 /ASSEMBLY_ACC=CAM_ASM_000383 /TAXON_ID=2969 /ORGANISM="Oxyrrhis marina" /LENGTH=479 /DNA_ID=CAMNT_0051247837 /DNA_START=115 /DNA_END=1554 /DNA_ORIENTATION=-